MIVAVRGCLSAVKVESASMTGKTLNSIAVVTSLILIGTCSFERFVCCLLSSLMAVGGRQAWFEGCQGLKCGGVVGDGLAARALAGSALKT